ncbi:MAG: hypothetical protein K2W92_07015, partial [Alphaproteobacteria bacterium]|nr:hypothetical protein [Alphaproteobacteria bacterium]
DKSARFRFETNMSPLSLRPRGLLDEKMVNTPEPDISDKPDRFNLKTNLSVMSGLSAPSLLDSFEERLAIAEYDGQQTHLQAHRIAYLDAFTLSYPLWLKMTLTKTDSLKKSKQPSQLSRLRISQG